MGNLPSQWSRLEAQVEKWLEADPWRANDPNKLADGYCYDMRTYYDTPVNRCCKVRGMERSSLKPALTPFVTKPRISPGLSSKARL